MKSHFRKVYAPHPSPKYKTEPMNDLGQEIVYVCGSPMYDTIIDREDLFEDKVADMLVDFDPAADVVIDHGDPMVFAMIMYHIGAYGHDSVYVGRYSRNNDSYVVRKFCYPMNNMQ